MKNTIVGTAGHIDHGKTALVKALTGIDADRLEEEKRRGITIDLGFAHLQLTPGLRLGFVAVSYTHLDVYKRQHHGHGRRAHGRAHRQSRAAGRA